MLGLPNNTIFAGICHSPAGGDVVGAAPHILSLKNAHMAYIVAVIQQGDVATTTLTPMQAASVAGVTKALTNTVPIAACLDYATSDELVATTAAKSYALDAALKKKIVIFAIDPLNALDQANEYDCITLDTSTSHANNIVAGLLFVVPRYNPPLSAIAD